MEYETTYKNEYSHYLMAPKTQQRPTLPLVIIHYNSLKPTQKYKQTLATRIETVILSLIQ